VFVKDGAVLINELQIAGRSKMTVKDFLNGFKLEGQWELK
jgi:methionyl-tRNA formyltransferase